MAKGKIDKSRRNFLFGAVRRMKNEKPEGPAASTEAAITTIKEANRLYVECNWEAARDKYKECLEEDKNDPDVRYRLGVCLYRLEKYIQAKVEFERAIRLRTGFHDAFLYLGLVMVRMGKPEKAIAVWRNYFNPKAIAVQRELNLQTGMIEEGIPDPPNMIAEAIEKAIADSCDCVG